MAKVVTVHFYSSEPEALVAKTALDAQNIHAEVVSDNGGSSLSSLSFANGVRLNVFEKDLEKARKILDRVK